MPSPTSPEGPLAAAVLLGWRVAELYALVDDTGAPGERHAAARAPEPRAGRPARAAAARRVRRRAAGGRDLRGRRPRRAGRRSPAARRARPRRPRRSAPGCAAATSRSRRTCGRSTRRPARPTSSATACRTPTAASAAPTGATARSRARRGQQVFLPERIERLKKLLDDLQSRLNASGVAVVRAQLDAWCAGVHARLAPGEAPLGAARPRRRAAPDRDLAPAAGGRQGAGGLPRPPRPRRAARRPAAADLAALPALDDRARRRRCSRSRSRSRT